MSTIIIIIVVLSFLFLYFCVETVSLKKKLSNERQENECLKENISQLIESLRVAHKLKGYSRFKISSPSGNASNEGVTESVLSQFFLKYQGRGWNLYGELQLEKVWINEPVVLGVCGANWGGADHSSCPDCNAIGGGEPVDGYWDYPTKWVMIL